MTLGEAVQAGVLWLVWICAGLFLINAALVFGEKYWRYMIFRIEENAVRQVGGKIADDAVWFEQDPHTKDLMKSLGIELAKTGHYNLSSVKNSYERRTTYDPLVRQDLDQENDFRFQTSTMVPDKDPAVHPV